MRLGELARRRGGVFTASEALAVGVSSGEVRRRLRSGLWVTPFGGGLRAATTPDSIDGRERAALLRAGEGAVLSHLSAARRWRLSVPPPADVWVTVSHLRNPRTPNGIRLVRSRHLPSTATRVVEGLPVFEPARTVADLAGLLDRRRLVAVVLEAMQRGLCTHDELVAWRRLLAGRPGSTLLAAALAEADPAFESILAAEFGALAERARVALTPRYELRLPSGQTVLCDFADLHGKIDFEVDGFAYHGTAAQIARDKARDRLLLGAGWVTVRYTTDDIRRRPLETIADVLRHVARRRHAG